MLHQIVRQQVCLLRQRICSSQIAFLQRRTRAAHIVSDLSHHLLLSRVERAFCQHFQLVVGRGQQPFRVLALASGFRGSHIGRNLRRRFARSALANHNLPRASIRRRGGALAAFRGSTRRASTLRSPARRIGIRLFIRSALRCLLLRCWRGFCWRSRSLSGGIRRACRLLLLRGNFRSRKT